MSGNEDSTSTSELPPAPEPPLPHGPGTGTQHEDTEEEKEARKNLQETKHCKICDEVLIHACRISCGHQFCRHCINLQRQFGAGKCPICGEKIGKIQNCPEIDAEIELIYNTLLIKDKFTREMKTSARMELEKDLQGDATPPEQDNLDEEDDERLELSSSSSQIRIPPPPNQKRTLPSGENITKLNSKENIPILEANLGYPHRDFDPRDESTELQDLEDTTDADDEDTEGEMSSVDASSSTPLVLHETITIHRTRVIDACTGTAGSLDAGNQEICPPPGSSSGNHANCGRASCRYNNHDNQSSASRNSHENPSYGQGRSSQSNSNEAYPCYSYQPYPNYNNYSTSSSYYQQYHPSYAYPHHEQGNGGNNGYAGFGSYQCPSSGGYGYMMMQDPGANSGYYSGQPQHHYPPNPAAAAAAEHGHQQHRQSQDEEEQDEDEMEQDFQSLDFHGAEEAEEDEYFEDVASGSGPSGPYGSGGGAHHQHMYQFQSEEAPIPCNCPACYSRQQNNGCPEVNDDDDDDDDDVGYQQCCRSYNGGGGGGPCNNTYHIGVSLTYRDNPMDYLRNAGTSSSDDTEINGAASGYQSGHYYGHTHTHQRLHSRLTREEAEGLFGSEEIDPEFIEFLETFESMGLSSPVLDQHEDNNNPGGGGTGGSSANRFMA